MISVIRKRARILLRLAIQIAPPERTDWFEAALSELDYIPDAELPRFSFGCMIAAIQARVTSPQFILAVVRWFLVCGAIAWAGLNIWFAGRMSVSNQPSLERFTYCMAAIFALGAIATARFGFKATIGLGAPFCLLLALSAISVRIGMSNSPDAALHIALIIEDLAVLFLALLIATFIPSVVTAEKALRQ